MAAKRVQKRAWKYNLHQIAAAAGVEFRQVKLARLEARLDPASLPSVAAYCVRQKMKTGVQNWLDGMMK